MRPTQVRPQLVVLEPRDAPAVLVNARTVDFRDPDGDTVRVTFNRPILTPANADTVLKFSTGTVNGSTSVAQVLQLIDLRSASNGTTVTVQALIPAGDGKADVGFINASGRDLGRVTVTGDLGRVWAGDDNGRTPGLANLAVGSLGAKGTTTQAAGGTLESSIDGALGGLQVDGHIVSARLQVWGNVGRVQVRGDIRGGSSSSYYGQIWAAGRIQSVAVGGSLVGGTGTGSGGIRSDLGIGSVLVGGSVVGGGGYQSARIETLGTLGPVKILGDLQGGAGEESGSLGAQVIRRYDPMDPFGNNFYHPFTGGNIVSVAIGGSVIGGGGRRSGQIQAQSTLGAVTVGGAVQGGSGWGSATIQATGALVNLNWRNRFADERLVLTGGQIASVTVGRSMRGGGGRYSGSIIAGSTLGPVKIGGDLVAANIYAGFSVDPYAGLNRTIGRGTITGVTVAGQVNGTTAPNDSFRISAVQVNSLKVGGVAVPLKPGPSNDSLALGTTNDFRVEEW